jgi:hypothetical protein
MFAPEMPGGVNAIDRNRPLFDDNRRFIDAIHGSPSTTARRF